MRILWLLCLLFAPQSECLQRFNRLNKNRSPQSLDRSNKLRTPMLLKPRLWKHLLALKNKGHEDATLANGFNVQGTAQIKNGNVKLDLTMQGANARLGDPSATTVPVSTPPTSAPGTSSTAASTAPTEATTAPTAVTTAQTAATTAPTAATTATTAATTATTAASTAPTTAATTAPTTAVTGPTAAPGLTSAAPTATSGTATTPVVSTGPTTPPATGTIATGSTTTGATTSPSTASVPSSVPTTVATTMAPATLGPPPVTMAPSLTSAMPTPPSSAATTSILITRPTPQPTLPGVSPKPTCESPLNVNIIIVAKEVLKSHNAYRRTHASPELQLDRLMSCDAQKFAQDIAHRGVLQHQASAILAKKRLGENIGMSCAPVRNGPLSAGRIIQMAKNVAKRWYDEVCQYNFDKPNTIPSTGHFTEIVWSGTKKLGVGYAVGRNAGFPGYQCVYVVGRYKPAGNIIGGQRLQMNVKRGSFNRAYCQKRSMGIQGDPWDKRNHLKHKESEAKGLQSHSKHHI